MIIVLSSVFAFILCAGAALVIYFKLRNRNLLNEASLTPAKLSGSNTFFPRIVPFFIIPCGTIEESREIKRVESLLLNIRPLFCMTMNYSLLLSL